MKAWDLEIKIQSPLFTRYVNLSNSHPSLYLSFVIYKMGLIRVLLCFVLHPFFILDFE